MTSYQYNIGEKARAGSRFLSLVRDEIQRAFAAEKALRNITQQAIADRLGVNRSVVNRQVMGLENLTLKTVGELLWAIGWEPQFEVRKPQIEFGDNAIVILASPDADSAPVSDTATAPPPSVNLQYRSWRP